MERKFADIGHRLETEPGLVSDITHTTGEAGRTVGGFGEAYQALKKGCSRGWQRMQAQTDEAIAYARREPVTAMTAAASFGFLVGLAALALGSRPGNGGGRTWLPRSTSRGSFFGRRRGASGWRGLLAR
jgi:hypothetical protein